MTTLRPIRNDALNKLAAVVRAEWGERCDVIEAGCATCMAWAVYDMMERITEGSTLDDPEEYARMREAYGPRLDVGEQPAG